MPMPLILIGWSACATGGIAATFSNGGQIAISGERSGIGGNFRPLDVPCPRIHAFGAQ